MYFPPATALVARKLPGGLPLVRGQVRARLTIRPSLDPDATPGDPGLFGPRSVTWRLIGQPTIGLAGLRAALLQSLSAPIPTATHSTGAFYDDFIGRVARTGAFVQAQNLGSMDEVYRTARRVRAMHRTVKGVAPDGTEYDASDPHQQTWVSMTLTESILAINERFGTGRLPRRTADRFVHDQSIHGALLDPRVDLDAVFDDPIQRAELQAGTLALPLIDEGKLPTTRADLYRLMDDWTPELSVTTLTRQLINAAVQLTEISAAQRAAIRPVVLATLSTVPDKWHRLLAPDANRVEEHLAAHALQLPASMLHAVLGHSGDLDIARARASAVA